MMENDTRKGIVSALIGELKASSPECSGAKRSELAVAIEAAIYAHSMRAPKRASPALAYAEAYQGAQRILREQLGSFPDDIGGSMIISGRLSPADAVAKGVGPRTPPSQREIVRRMFIRTLFQSEPAFALNRAESLAIASELEEGCLEAVIAACRTSDTPTRRAWDSGPFVDIYGTRCGTVNAMLDGKSSACRAYGSPIIPRLVARLSLATPATPPATSPPATSPPATSPATSPPVFDARRVGFMTERELCPEASAKERAEIRARSQQKVVEKESNLFACPHCGARRCTYEQVQRRALDEPPDYYCLCISCNRRFKGY